MRLLVHGASVAGEDVRIAHAAVGLALRGHQVTWLDPSRGDRVRPASEEAAALGTLAMIHRVRDVARGSTPRADLVLGGHRAPVRTAVAGWIAGARAMGLDFDATTTAPWGVLGRWCWESLDGFVLHEAAGSGDGEAGEGEIEPERRLWWSEDAIGEHPEPDHADCEILERACERWLSHRDGPPAPAVFIDRDGTLVVERGYLADPDEVELLPGVAQGLRELRSAGFRLVVVSNQSGVGRGFFSRRRVYQVMARLRALLRGQGVELDAVYFCPHRPEAGCPCRKPGTALLEAAARNLNLSLEHSVMVGDKLLDAATGQRAGGLGLLVRTGYGHDEASRADEGLHGRAPDGIVEGFDEAARWILARRERL